MCIIFTNYKFNHLFLEYTFFFYLKKDVFKFLKKFMKTVFKHANCRWKIEVYYCFEGLVVGRVFNQ